MECELGIASVNSIKILFIRCHSEELRKSQRTAFQGEEWVWKLYVFDGVCMHAWMCVCECLCGGGVGRKEATVARVKLPTQRVVGYSFGLILWVHFNIFITFHFLLDCDRKTLGRWHWQGNELLWLVFSGSLCLLC